MLNTPKVRCTGCTACVAACPKSCLRMERDKEGFFYPVAEEAACINCDRCNRVCPAQKSLPVDDKEPFVTPPFLGKTDSGHKVPPVACSPFWRRKCWSRAA